MLTDFLPCYKEAPSKNLTGVLILKRSLWLGRSLCKLIKCLRQNQGMVTENSAESRILSLGGGLLCSQITVLGKNQDRKSGLLAISSLTVTKVLP